MLNEYLYKQLKEQFKEVRVVNEDAVIEVSEYHDELGNKRMRREHGGEQYAVNCPCCNDKRQRLYISHAWGMDAQYAMPTSKFVTCFNEHCEENKDPRMNPRNLLEDAFSPKFSKIKNGAVQMPRVEKVAPGRSTRVVDFPEPRECHSLLSLPEDHEVIQYLVGERNLDLKVLDRYMVTYVPSFNRISNDGKSLAWLSGRVFIPVFSPDGGLIEGWQARVIGNDKTKQKYFNSPGWAKSKSLYGTNENKHPVALVCEGVTDVYRLGAGVCTFGKTVSASQGELIKKHFSHAALLFDPDAQDDKVNSMEVALRQLRRMVGKDNVVHIELPGFDIADMSYEDAWRLVRKALDKRGFPNPDPEEL